MKHVLVVEDDHSLREAICDMLEINDLDYVDVENGQKAIEALQDNNFQVVISDVQMSPVNGYQLLKYIKENHNGLPVILMTAYGSIPQAVDAIQAGAVDYLVKPFNVKDLIQSLSNQLNPQMADESGMIAKDPASIELVKLAKKVAATEATVLLNGDSGVGKEVYSKFIHQQSERADQPFIAINCAAIPENMLEAVLFGYEKGAFTGAYKATPGKFEQAHKGTLLLDEISEMDVSLQAKLLRVIQEKEVERLGGLKTIQLDVRIIATTNRNLKTEVTEKRFREDLYYRLNVIKLSVPTLQERGNDVFLLADYFLEKIAERWQLDKATLSTQSINALSSYPFPGNVRELENILERASTLCDDNIIHPADLQLPTVNQITSMTPNQPDPVLKTLNEISGQGSVQNLPESFALQSTNKHEDEKEQILYALDQTRWNRTAAAKLLGMTFRQLRYRIKKYELDHSE